MTLIKGLALACIWLVLSPEDVFAWGPGTHIALGEGLLRSLDLIPPAVASLLQRYPIHFLYGTVAADISFAKKYVPEGRHCHAWPVGEEILEEADTEPLKATGYGYLCHLAADTIAHNFFVPRKLLLTRSTKALGHTYWEMRMDAQVGEEFMSKARRLVVDYDHGPADTLFDEVLSHTLFSFRTNRRIFRGMVRVHDNDGWKKVFEQVLKNARFELPALRVQTYLNLSFDYMVSYLNAREASVPVQLDPTGEIHLRLAKKLRRVALASPTPSREEEVLQAADEFFPLPEAPYGHWKQREGVETEANGKPSTDPEDERG